MNHQHNPAGLAGHQVTFDAERAMRAAIAAAERAAGQAWRASAIRLAEQYLATIKTRPFMTEDLRGYCYAQGLRKPKSERAWGAIILQLTRSGRIHAQGTAKVRNPKAHQANATIWSTGKPYQQ